MYKTTMLKGGKIILDKELYNSIVEYFDNEYLRLQLDIMNEWGIDDYYNNENEYDLMRAVDERFFKAFGFKFNNL